MTKSLIGVGSNLGNRKDNIEFAFMQIKNIPRTKILSVSSLYETEAIGGPEQDAFLNAVALVETDLAACELLTELQSIETAAGRKREIKWGPRTLDLDIIDFEGFESASEELQIPHPRATSRRFVLEPLLEVSPGWHISGESVEKLLNHVQGQQVTKLDGTLQ